MLRSLHCKSSCRMFNKLGDKKNVNLLSFYLCKGKRTPHLLSKETGTGEENRFVLWLYSWDLLSNSFRLAHTSQKRQWLPVMGKCKEEPKSSIFAVKGSMVILLHPSTCSIPLIPSMILCRWSSPSWKLEQHCSQLSALYLPYWLVQTTILFCVIYTELTQIIQDILCLRILNCICEGLLIMQSNIGVTGI